MSMLIAQKSPGSREQERTFTVLLYNHEERSLRESPKSLTDIGDTCGAQCHWDLGLLEGSLHLVVRQSSGVIHLQYDMHVIPARPSCKVKLTVPAQRL
jgi:hypothetical protein